MSDKTPEQIELESLRNHNAELLSDLKKARKKVAEATEQLEALAGERDDAMATLRRLTLERPVEEMAKRVSSMPEPFLREFEARGYRFELDGNDVVIRDSEGNPATLGEEVTSPEGKQIKMRDVAFTEADITKLVSEDWLPKEKRSKHAGNFDQMVIASRASGAGRHGDRGTPGMSPSAQQKPSKPRLATGLK